MPVYMPTIDIGKLDITKCTVPATDAEVVNCGFRIVMVDEEGPKCCPYDALKAAFTGHATLGRPGLEISMERIVWQ